MGMNPHLDVTVSRQRFYAMDRQGIAAFGCGPCGVNDISIYPFLYGLQADRFSLNGVQAPWALYPVRVEQTRGYETIS